MDPSARDLDQFSIISTVESRHNVFGDYSSHSGAARKATNVALNISIRKHHPELALTVTPTFSCDLLGFAAAGHAQAQLDSREPPPLFSRSYIPPPKELDGDQGVLATHIVFAKYNYQWKDSLFLLYIAEGFEDGGFGSTINSYLLHEPDHHDAGLPQSKSSDELIFFASKWTLELHHELWVYDQGYWQKNRQLWEAAQGASWKDVILDDEMKQAVIDDADSFFDSRDVYKEFGIPWKRGIIFHGPPGNGKTISIKALIGSLLRRQKPISSLYVKSFKSYAGPELAIRMIFTKARQVAPCLLILEDIDSLVGERVRSYFLNEVDGLESNDGILIIASTNHLERLDPGLAKRPSRFDRKYLFPLPDLAQRTRYCGYWRDKLKDNKEISFPQRLCSAIAKITDDFSFAYMKEAFVAALRVIVIDRASKRERAYVDDDDLDSIRLWREIKKQVANLREEMGNESRAVERGLRQLAVS